MNFLAASAFEARTTSTSVGVEPTTRVARIALVTSLQNLDQKAAAVQKFTSAAHCTSRIQFARVVKAAGLKTRSVKSVLVSSPTERFFYHQSDLPTVVLWVM